MGKWATYRRRGGGAGSSSELFAVALQADGDPDMSWVYLHPDPDHWDMEQSLTGVGGWSIFDQVSGNNRDDHSEPGGFFYRIIGRTAGGVASTAYSNVVSQL